MCIDVCLGVYLYTACVPGIREGHKTASDPLEELWIAVSHHKGARN